MGKFQLKIHLCKRNCSGRFSVSPCK